MKVRFKSRESIMELDTTVKVMQDGSFCNSTPKMLFTSAMQYLFGKVIEVEQEGIYYTTPRHNDPSGDSWYLVADWFVVIPKPKLSFSKGDKYE